MKHYFKVGLKTPDESLTGPRPGLLLRKCLVQHSFETHNFATENLQFCKTWLKTGDFELGNFET